MTCFLTLSLLLNINSHQNKIKQEDRNCGFSNFGLFGSDSFCNWVCLFTIFKCWFICSHDVCLFSSAKNHTFVNVNSCCVVAMAEEKDAFYVVKKRDVVGIYKSFSDIQALLTSSVCHLPPCYVLSCCIVFAFVIFLHLGRVHF